MGRGYIALGKPTMHLTQIEKGYLARPIEPHRLYTDEELDQMSWRELGRLSPLDESTVRYRVVHKHMTRREALVYKTPKHRSEMSRIAAKYGIAYKTLEVRRRRSPNTPLEDLAKRPVLRGEDRVKPGLRAMNG